jgi:hypothetical protein
MGVTPGGGGVQQPTPPPNTVILQFCRDVLAILTTHSLGKKYVIEQKIIKLMENTIFFCLKMFSPPPCQQFW